MDSAVKCVKSSTLSCRIDRETLTVLQHETHWAHLIPIDGIKRAVGYRLCLWAPAAAWKKSALDSILCQGRMEETGAHVFNMKLIQAIILEVPVWGDPAVQRCSPSPCSSADLRCDAPACSSPTAAWPSPYCCWSRCPWWCHTAGRTGQ